MKSVVLSISLLASVVAATKLEPTVRIGDDGVRPDYERLIPRQFATWSMVDTSAATVIDPRQQEVLDRTYSQLVTRSYRDVLTGRIVMLVAAYSSEQNKQSQVHLPEVCYPAQGFRIVSGTQGKLQLIPDVLPVPVKKLLTVRGAREEHITYWVRVGDKVVNSSLQQKFARVEQGLAGRVVDGLLFRISSIDSDYTSASQLQDRFLKDLLLSLTAHQRAFLVGV